MRRILQVVAWGVVGAVVAASLIGGAFVLAGTSLTEPATAVRVVGPPLRAGRPDRHEPDGTAQADDTSDAGTPSPDPASSVAIASVPGSPVSAASTDGTVERGDD